VCSPQIEIDTGGCLAYSPGCTARGAELAFALSGANATRDLVPAALATLARFAFVGLTDRWRDSVCLFHAMHGGVPRPRQFGLVARRPEAVARLAVEPQPALGKGGAAAPAPAGAPPLCRHYDEARLGDWRDADDEAIYAAARARFDADLRRHRTCLPGAPS